MWVFLQIIFKLELENDMYFVNCEPPHTIFYEHVVWRVKTQEIPIHASSLRFHQEWIDVYYYNLLPLL